MLWGFGILVSRVKSKTCPPRFYPSSNFGDDLVCKPCPLHYKSCKQQGKDQRRCKKHCGKCILFLFVVREVLILGALDRRQYMAKSKLKIKPFINFRLKVSPI